MPLYGCPLWDYSDKSICKLYVAWRKAVRSILRLPRRTHCSLLNEICSDLSIDDQLYSRFVNFFQSLLYNTNELTNMCAKLALRGSNSIDWRSHVLMLHLSNNAEICYYHAVLVILHP